MEIISINTTKMHRHSGFYILPVFMLNISYKTLTVGWIKYLIHITINTFNEPCPNCGKICKNKVEAQNHCIENF